jgi:hypothetical protein
MGLRVEILGWNGGNDFVVPSPFHRSGTVETVLNISPFRATKPTEIELQPFGTAER